MTYSRALHKNNQELASRQSVVNRYTHFCRNWNRNRNGNLRNDQTVFSKYIITWIGAIVGLAGMFRIYFKEKSEEKKTPKLAFGEAYKRDDNSYFIDVGLISGHGRAQRCVGYITVEYSDIDNSSTVWEHSALREYDIGSHMGLRLFKGGEEENNFILFPAALGHMISGFAENPRLLDVFRNKQIKIEVNFINGPKPEPYIDRLSNIVDNAPLR
jgi:hypothetical protein